MAAILAHPDAARPSGFLPLGIFFFFGSVMATYAAVTLLEPGTFLDRAWQLNPTGHAELSSLGRAIGIPFLLLAAALLAAGIGWFRRRRWGWILGTTIIAVNLTGDAIHLLTGDLKSLVGIPIAGLLLFYMTRNRVRNYFVQ
jgi:hypothetical protein